MTNVHKLEGLPTHYRLDASFKVSFWAGIRMAWQSLRGNSWLQVTLRYSQEGVPLGGDLNMKPTGVDTTKETCQMFPFTPDEAA